MILASTGVLVVRVVRTFATSVASGFLSVRPGDIVVVEEHLRVVGADRADWWVAYVMHIVGGARDPSANSLFQVACVDTGKIRTINADVVKGILQQREGKS